MSEFLGFFSVRQKKKVKEPEVGALPLVSSRGQQLAVFEPAGGDLLLPIGPLLGAFFGGGGGVLSSFHHVRPGPASEKQSRILVGSKVRVPLESGTSPLKSVPELSLWNSASFLSLSRGVLSLFFHLLGLVLRVSRQARKGPPPFRNGTLPFSLMTCDGLIWVGGVRPIISHPPSFSPLQR